MEETMKLYDSGVYLVNGNELVPDGVPQKNIFLFLKSAILLRWFRSDERIEICL